MQANRRRDTAAELALRSELHRRGARYRVDFPIRPPSGRLIRPDIVFPRKRVAVFVDGCFWHACPIHGTRPTANRTYWETKLVANRARDLRQTQALESAGWVVIRVWEHEAPRLAAARILAALAAHGD
jgi:DNA mismatch endonuclease (patch repair protein)